MGDVIEQAGALEQLRTIASEAVQAVPPIATDKVACPVPAWPELGNVALLKRATRPATVVVATTEAVPELLVTESAAAVPSGALVATTTFV